MAKPAFATPFALIGDNGAYPWRRKHFLGLVVPEVEDVFSILSLIRSNSFSHVMGLKEYSIGVGLLPLVCSSTMLS